MSQGCHVVVDSSASLPEALALEWGIRVVPLDVVVDGEPTPEGPQMTSEDVLERLHAGKTVTTSQPSVGAFLEAYRAAAESGAESVVSIHISGEVSGTVNTATIAAGQAPIPVTVVDSRTLVMGLGYAALAAGAVARRGAPVDEVAAAGRRAAESSATFFTVDSLEYLKRGGRVPQVAAILGEALHIRPILGLVDGRVEVVERVRTTTRARERVVKEIEDRVDSMSRPAVAVTGLGIGWYLDNVSDWLRARHPRMAVTLSTSLSAALAVHGGPGAFAASIADLPSEFS